MHKEKILRKYTIVPKNLYVNRKADKHLKIIIHEMLKPGYVSVSRQMGKSNLLINAKLELENENNILLYLDCSTPAETSRECFRNFIDVLLENYNDKFDEAAFEIVKKRKELNLTPAKEHENELKILLKYFKGNLIFILDEVDALAKVDYSDEIFAQIRSIYFTRIQTKNFDRLTYILSGVIDPNKLIKNKDNSPFNIADKITLDDFETIIKSKNRDKAGFSVPAHGLDLTKIEYDYITK